MARKKGEEAIEMVQICLRMKKAAFDIYETEAIARTKETGKGVTPQKIINEKLDEVLTVKLS
jgi:hypothetical protein